MSGDRGIEERSRRVNSVLGVVVDQRGFIVHPFVTIRPIAAIGKRKLEGLHGIVVHQTGGPTVASALTQAAKGGAAAHFYVDKDGSIYQVASLYRMCGHVGFLKPRCLFEHSCKDAVEAKRIQKLFDKANTANTKILHKEEKNKPFPDRYPMNEDSIGIELVGWYLPKHPSKGVEPVYDRFTERQNQALAWLIPVISRYHNKSSVEIYRHPQVSRKTSTEAATAIIPTKYEAPQPRLIGDNVMVKQMIVTLTVLILTSFAPAQVNEGDLELPQSYKTAFIKQVVVKGNSLSSENRPEICSGFILKEEDVIDYFRSAKRIGWGLYDYRYQTGCYSAGEIIFRNGDHGTWRIDGYRLGVLTLSDGRYAYFYGLGAHAKVFGGKGDPHYKDIDFGIPSTPEPPVKLGPIKSITFRKNLTWEVSEEQRAGKCHFELSENDVRDFFLNAKVIDLEAYNDKIYGKGKPVRLQALKGCQVEGDIEFADGQTGSWMITNSRTCILDINRGDRTFLYAKNAKAKAFNKP